MRSRRRGRRLVPTALALLLLLLSGSTAGLGARADSVILIVGDGLDDHQITIGRNYLLGADGRFAFDELPHRASALVQTVLEEEPGRPEYVADSASGGTALAAGVVTSRGRIATTAGTDRDVVTILELAQRAGKATGLVTTASVTDATPASFVAHVNFRYCEDPGDMAPQPPGHPGCEPDLVSRGGAGSIAEQIARSRVHVVLGGGLAPFEERNEAGDQLLELARRSGYRLLRTAEELAELEAPSRRHVLGLFGAGTLPVDWMGEGGARASRIALAADGRPVDPEIFRCVENPLAATRPSLETMTAKALELLRPAAEEGEGFFLMVESASIDKQAHAANPCGQIGEIRALDRAVVLARRFAAEVGDTLIVVTSDHGHAGQVVPYPSLFATRLLGSPVQAYPAGKVARLRTLEGGVMTVHYGTDKNFLEEHTGTQVPVYAEGPGAERVRGLMRQREVFDVMKAALGL